MSNKLDEGLKEILDAHAIFSQNYLGRRFTRESRWEGEVKMSQSEIPDFEKLLQKDEINKFLEFLINDQAFSTEFLASCIANYYCSSKNTIPNHISKGEERR